MADRRYLFIDGGYLKARHKEALTSVFGEAGDLNLSSIRYSRDLRGGPSFEPFQPFQRVFYYDCLHDILKDNETKEQLETRIAKQQAFFDELQAYDGFHVRLGSLSGTSRKFRQKEVDVLLAVDVLDHALRQNMNSATLLAGDLDFAPLVEALVRLGTWVEILHDRRHAPKRLLEVADKAIPISFQNYHEWCRDDFKKSHALPIEDWQHDFAPTAPEYHLLRGGICGADPVHLYRRGDYHVVAMGRGEHTLLLTHPDAVVLENYFSFTRAPIAWT